jgi:hypothetical protein
VGKEDSPRAIIAPAFQVADVAEGDAGQFLREFLHPLLKNAVGDYDGVGCGIDLDVAFEARHEVYPLTINLGSWNQFVESPENFVHAVLRATRSGEDPKLTTVPKKVLPPSGPKVTAVKWTY